MSETSTDRGCDRHLSKQHRDQSGRCPSCTEDISFYPAHVALAVENYPSMRGPLPGRPQGQSISVHATCAQTICFALNVKIMDQRSSISSKPNPESINCLMVDISRLDGFEKPIKLPCNDSAFWMSPQAIEAGLNSLERSHLYPEVNTDRLAAAIEAVIS